MPVQTILDGPRNVVVKIVDNTGSESGIAVDVSALVPSCTRVNIDHVWFSCLDAEEILLSWDATTDEVALVLHGQQDFCFTSFAGLTNNAGAGVTGDLLYTMPAGGGTVVLHCTKRGDIDPLL